MGYVNIKELWYKFSKSVVLENYLKVLSDDKGAMHMVNIARRNRQVHMFVIHSICEVEVMENFLEYFPEEVVAETGTKNVEVQGEVDGHIGCGDGDHINYVEDNNVVHEAEMQQDNIGCHMEYELEDDANSHYNIRVQPQTEVDPEIEVDVNVEVQPETKVDQILVEENNEVEAEVAVQPEVDVHIGIAHEVVGGVQTECDLQAHTGAEAEIRIGEERNEGETDSDHIVSEEDLDDVSVHYEDNLWEGNGEEDVEEEELEFDGSAHVDMHDRGLFGDGWEFDNMDNDDPNSDESLASGNQCKANFGTFKMPKSMAQN